MNELPEKKAFAVEVQGKMISTADYKVNTYVTYNDIILLCESKPPSDPDEPFIVEK